VCQKVFDTSYANLLHPVIVNTGLCGRGKHLTVEKQVKFTVASDVGLVDKNM
jgi:hypothetical protein